jgi:hypothetical protein
VRRLLTPGNVLLALVLLVGLVLRVRNNDYGLPYVYNVDEGSHFTNRAVEMFGGDANPGYFQNPSGFTYLVHLALWLRHFDDVVQQFKVDPTAIYVTARTLATIICLAGVVCVYITGKRLWDERAGFAAATVLCFAFLPVAYSRVAVTDAGTLAPVALAMLFSALALEQRRLRWLALAGAAAGLAVGFKYTAGLVLLPVLLPAALALRDDRLFAAKAVALALAAAALAFFVTTPYFFIDFDTARHQIRAQADTAGDFAKLGQGNDNGFLYYLDSLRWGLGWAGMAAALAGAVMVARREWLRALLLALFPVALFVYLAVQSRFFGRWLLPAYPVLALFAGYALAQASELARRWRWPALCVLLALVMAQPLAADVRTMRLLGREDTRDLARAYLVERLPPASRVVIEPAVPARWYRLRRPRSKVPTTRKQFVRGFARDIAETRIDYAATLTPERLERYRELGFCVVVTMSVIRGRAENDKVAGALAYYATLEREAELVGVFSPYKKGAKAPRFHFDLSYNYYPRAFQRPGPEVRVYRLDNCQEKRGPLPPGAGRPEGP